MLTPNEARYLTDLLDVDDAENAELAGISTDSLRSVIAMLTHTSEPLDAAGFYAHHLGPVTTLLQRAQAAVPPGLSGSESAGLNVALGKIADLVDEIVGVVVATSVVAAQTQQIRQERTNG